MSNLGSRLISVTSQKRDLSLQKEMLPSCIFTKARSNVTFIMRLFEKKFLKYIISYEVNIQVFDCTCLLSLSALDSKLFMWVAECTTRKWRALGHYDYNEFYSGKKTNITPLISVAIPSDFCFHIFFFDLKFWLPEKREIQNASRFTICAPASCVLRVSVIWHNTDIMLTMQRLHSLSATVSFHKLPEETMGALPNVFHFPTTQKSKP